MVPNLQPVFHGFFGWKIQAFFGSNILWSDPFAPWSSSLSSGRFMDMWPRQVEDEHGSKSTGHWWKIHLEVAMFNGILRGNLWEIGKNYYEYMDWREMNFLEGCKMTIQKENTLIFNGLVEAKIYGLLMRKYAPWKWCSLGEVDGIEWVYNQL